MKKEPKYKYSDILRSVRQRIKNLSGDRFICNNISTCSIGTVDQKIYLRKWIGEMLGVRSTYEGWLEKTHPRTWERFILLDYDERRQARLDWIDYMIGYWEERGQ